MQTRFHIRFMTLTTIFVAAGLLTACGWVTGIGEPVVDVPDGDPTIGRQAIEDFGCIACHSIPGVPRADAHVGPPLDNWADRRFIAGEEPNVPDTLILFLMDPKSINPQSAMPVTGLTEEDARHIAAYLYTLTD